MSWKGIDLKMRNSFYRLLQISSLIETVPGVLILRGDDTKKQKQRGRLGWVKRAKDMVI